MMQLLGPMPNCSCRHRVNGGLLLLEAPTTLKAGPYRGRQPSRSQAGQVSFHNVSHTDELYQWQRGISLTWLLFLRQTGWYNMHMNGMNLRMDRRQGRSPEKSRSSRRVLPRGRTKNRQLYTESEIWSYDFWSSHRQTEINWHITY